jgi:arginine/lysine/ornithine decarboxylase/amino acid transporter
LFPPDGLTGGAGTVVEGGAAVASVRPLELAADAAATVRRSRAERSKLRRELGRLDAVCLLIAAIVVLDTLGAVARGGAQTLTWMAVVAALFFVPAGLVVAELGAAFPNQGGPYVWARLAFGRRAGSLVALAYFLEPPVWVGGSLAITCVAVIDRLVLPLEGVWRVPVALAFVWTTVALAAAPLRAGKRVPLAGAATQVGLLVVFTATVAAYAAGHGVHAPAIGALAPSRAVFALVAPVLVYNFLGFELPSAAGEELRDPARDVPASIVRAGVLTCALYAVPVLAVVLVVPADRLTGLTGFIDALAEVFVVYGPWAGLAGGLAALAFVWVLVANGLAWVMASARTQAAASLDGVGPPGLGRVSARTGTPVAATLASGLVATVTTLAAFAVAGDDNSRYFSAALTLAISLLALANLVVFPSLVRLRRTHPDRPRSFRVPGGAAGALAASALATGWSAVALAAALWPGLGTGDPDAHLPDGFAGQRLAFTLTGLVPLAAVLVAAVLLVRPGPAPARTGTRAAAAQAPFARAAQEFLDRGDAHFSIPGHKRNPALVGDHPALLADMPHLCGVDDIRASRDLLGQAERLAARAWGADRTWFSVSGSTMANQAMCLAVAAPGDRVVVARTSHRSVMAGLVLAGLEPAWVSPDVDPATGLALAVPPGRVERALGDHPDARAVILVEPSYLGLTSDVASIARVAHDHGAALLCDQAWGAHFAFHPALPACAVTAGADLVVMSGHKTLTAFSQGAMLHAVDRGLVDLDRVDAGFQALMTTSASGLIHASLDQARALIEREGTGLVEAAIGLAERFRARIDGYLGARCLDRRLLAHPSVHGVDPLKLVVDLTGTGADGFEVERDLRGDGVVLEMADRATLVPLLTIGDDRRSVDRLAGALRRSIARRAGRARSSPAAGVSWRISPQPVLSPRDAFFAPHERVPATAAAGRVAAEIISPYPPGIPAIAPGELITTDLLEALRDEARAGSRMAGASDPTLETVLVVRS